MKQNRNIYQAEEGNFIVRISDGFTMGEDIDLGTEDSIDNYEEQPYTEESYNAFYESLGSDKRFIVEESSKKLTKSTSGKSLSQILSDYFNKTNENN